MADGTTSPAPAPAAITPTQPPASGQPPSWGRKRLLPLGLLLLVLLGGGGAGAYWWLHRAPGIPKGIAFSNGRLEADEIDIDTKFAGRISEMMVDEGAMVRTGQIVARLDTRDLQAMLAQAQAQITQAKQSIVQAQADLVQMGGQLKLSVQQLGRARTLTAEGYETREVLDQRQSQFNTATANYHATEARIVAAEAGMQSAIHNADLIQVNIADNTLVAPKDGPIQYRLSNVGEVLAAGGKVFTMLDVTDVYMDIFLPTQTAGRIKLGDEARLVLDAIPERPIRAAVSFIAAQNEFTPKTVETQSERDKLMFRIRVRIDPKLLHEHEAQVRSGLPGLAYIRFDPKTEWPAALQPHPAP